MPVKKVGAMRKPKSTFKKSSKGKAAVPSLSLPENPKPETENFSSFTTLIYGREKIGKSTLCASFPKALFFAFEPGLKGITCFEFFEGNGVESNWANFKAGVSALIQDKARRFQTVVIDTADRCYDYCLDYVCSERGIEYPGQDASGDEDYGKSWRAVKQEFLSEIHKLASAGYGIVFTSHAKEQEIRTRGGERYTRIFPTMGNQARTVIEALVDFFLYAEYVKGEGGIQRVLITEGDDTIWAGARKPLPKFLPLVKENGYQVLEDAFRGKPVGIRPGSVRAAKTTSKTGGQFLKREETLAARKGKTLKKKGGATRTRKSR